MGGHRHKCAFAYIRFSRKIRRDDIDEIIAKARIVRALVDRGKGGCGTQGRCRMFIERKKIRNDERIFPGERIFRDDLPIRKPPSFRLLRKFAAFAKRRIFRNIDEGARLDRGVKAPPQMSRPAPFFYRRHEEHGMRNARFGKGR